jgi:hypothetical protein
MFCFKFNTIEHHPIAMSFIHNTSQLKMISYSNVEMLEVGAIPTHLLDEFKDKFS